MKKLLTLTAAVLASFSLWAESVTFSATEMSGKTDGVTKGQITALCPTSASDQQWYKEGGSTTIKEKAINLNSSADSAVIIPVASKSLHFRVADGYTITGISIEAAASKDSICGEPIVIWAGAINKTPAYVGNIEVPSRAETSKPAAIEITNIPENATGFALYRRIKYNSSTGEIGSGSNYGRSLQTWNIFNVTVTYSANCTSPANPLVLSSDAAETVYAGDVINLSTTGGNGVGIGVAGTADETLGGYAGLTWTATAGEHTFVATQVAYNGYCAQESELVFNVLEKTPVTACSIDGPTAGYVGNELTYTATAANATDYQWLVDGVDANTNAASFTYTGAKGEHSIVCKARNDFNETDEWIASDPIALTVTKLCGELIKATLTSGSAATVTGIIGGTANVSLSSSKKMDKGKYFGITLASGNFQEGDTVVITMTTAGTNYPCLFGDKEKTKLLYLATESSSDLVYKIVLPAEAADLNSLYLVRDADDATYKWNPVLASMAVIRPMDTKSVVESLTGLSIDGEALDAASLAALQSAHNFGTAVQYVNAPTMVFTKHVVITYEDDSQVESDKEIEVLATDLGDSFEARATINGIEYIISTGKATSFVVTYMDGTTELGTENVAINGNPANYADFQNKSLATFVGWYSDPELENAVADMSAEVITAAKTYYAKFEDAYATSINFEKAVMQNSKKYGIIAQLGAQHFATNITGSLDSLDNSKADKLRNYAYLGLKVKQAGAMLDFRLAAGNTVKIKFGNIATTPQVSIDGGAYADMTITDKVYAHTATANEIISIKMANGNAVVFQQIMIDEELQAPELFAINCAEAENGTVAAPYKLGIPGEKVTLTVTPAEGYQIASVTLDGDVLVADGDVYSFDMPAKDVAVAATFSVATAIDNTDAAVKATKVLRDGQVLILRDDKFFNALGVEVK
ncbi:MAG: hypothetical protein ACI4AI_01720 [Paludibacteraceae bacterium]